MASAQAVSPLCEWHLHRLQMHFTMSSHAGYLTPPGVGAYWVDCWYAPYVAFICCNGFALVFSVAAIFAVVMGPIILVCLNRPNWRKQVAVLAIIHLTLSLLSLLAAFAAAGFVTASVKPPDLNCGNLKCEDGGVPCPAYTLRYKSGLTHVRLNRTSDHLVKVFADGEDFSFNDGGLVDTGIQLIELVLDPVVAQLNNDTFGNAGLLENPGSEVMCRDYRYLANICSPDGLPKFSKLNDTHGKPIDKACLVLLDAYFGVPRSKVDQNLYRARGSSRSGWRKFKPNAHTLWCSTNTSNLGLGWLPLTLYTGMSLMRHFSSETYGFSWPYRCYDSRLMSGYSYNSTMGCPDFQLNMSVLSDQWGMDVMELLSDNENAWDGDGQARYHFAGDYVDCDRQEQTRKFDRVFWYADLLGWDRSGVLFRPSRREIYGEKALCRDRVLARSWSNNRPLQGAKLYASLRYQCSSLDKGVLCDFGVDPPLAVSPDGKYLNKRNMPDLPDVVIFGSLPTATAVKWAVIGMIVAAMASIFASVIFLACWPGDARFDASSHLREE